MLDDGACVFDVGANIGFFTLFVQQIRQNVRVFAFEPIPAIFETLRINTSLYGSRQGNESKLFQCGLAEAAGEVEFTFYPNSTSQSGRYGDETDEREVLRSIIANVKPESSNAGEQTDRYLEELVESRVSGEKVICQLRTLSDVIREEGIERIDLLKIDVEKSEADVLAGIAAQDWEKIQQIVIEAHDVDGQLARLIELLKDHGYRVLFAPPALVLVTAFVTVPFVARELIPVLEAVGPEEELAARSLRAQHFAFGGDLEPLRY